MSKLFTFLIILLPFFTFSQAVHFKPVKIEVLTEFGKTYHEVISVTFYRNKDVGFDLYTHNGGLVGKVEIRAVLPSNHPLDPKIMALISSDVYKREKELYKSQESQKFVAGALALLTKIIISTI